MTSTKRKIVQIALSETTVMVLCNDGTLWSTFPKTVGWTKLLNVPQPKRRKRK